MPDLTIEKFKKEIQQWDWSKLKKQALSNVQQALSNLQEREDGGGSEGLAFIGTGEDGGGSEGLAFIGTVFSLLPSGKYYTAWAKSNVEPCPKCNGKETIVRRRGNQIIHAELVAQQRKLRMDAIAKYGGYAKGQWTKETVDEIELLGKQIDSVAPTRTCPMCGGVGSREVYLDELYNRTLVEIAEEHGMWITEGEGDPCDIFAGINIDTEETEEE